MKVDGVLLNGIKPLQPPSWAVKENASAAPAGDKSFADYLKDSLHQVDQMQQRAGEAAMRMAAGDETDIHKTMIAYEKAALALQLTIEVRNKMVEAYQEIMRIQM